MKLLITSQTRENYGAHDWDGTGACPQYWKNKGGCYYVVENVSTDAGDIEMVAEWACSQINDYSEYWDVWVVDWELVADDYKTDYERWQEEYDGAIVYRPNVLELPEEIRARMLDKSITAYEEFYTLEARLRA